MVSQSSTLTWTSDIYNNWAPIITGFNGLQRKISEYYILIRERMNKNKKNDCGECRLLEDLWNLSYKLTSPVLLVKFKLLFIKLRGNLFETFYSEELISQLPHDNLIFQIFMVFLIIFCCFIRTFSWLASLFKTKKVNIEQYCKIFLIHFLK